MPINNSNFVDKRRRPVFLNLLVLRLPVGGVVSILHRITGVLLVLLIPVALYALDRSLSDPDYFQLFRNWMGLWWGKLLVLLVLLILIQHFLSGLRHLALDIDLGIDKQTAKLTAWLTFAGTLILLAGFQWWLG